MSFTALFPCYQSNPSRFITDEVFILFRYVFIDTKISNIHHSRIRNSFEFDILDCLKKKKVQEFRDLVNKHFQSMMNLSFRISQGQLYDSRDLKRFNEIDAYSLMFIQHGQFGTSLIKIEH
jgi:hypothetical protein